MLRKIMLAASAGALLLGLLAVPAAAQSTATVWDINGIPGTRLDICVNGDEVVSGLRYGSASDTAIAAGPAKVQVRLAALGNCKGTRLLAADLDFVADRSYTLVAWKPSLKPALKLFENDLALPTTEAVTLTMRHTAKAGPIDVWVWQHVKVQPTGLYDPAFDDLAKGRQSGQLVLDERQTMLEAFPATKTTAWGYEYFWTYFYAGGAYQAYFIGNARANYQIIMIGQPGVLGP